MIQLLDAIGASHGTSATPGSVSYQENFISSATIGTELDDFDSPDDREAAREDEDEDEDEDTVLDDTHHLASAIGKVFLSLNCLIV